MPLHLPHCALTYTPQCPCIHLQCHYIHPTMPVHPPHCALIYTSQCPCIHPSVHTYTPRCPYIHPIVTLYTLHSVHLFTLVSINTPHDTRTSTPLCPYIHFTVPMHSPNSVHTLPSLCSNTYSSLDAAVWMANTWICVLCDIDGCDYGKLCLRLNRHAPVQSFFPLHLILIRNWYFVYVLDFLFWLHVMY